MSSDDGAPVARDAAGAHRGQQSADNGQRLAVRATQDRDRSRELARRRRGVRLGRRVELQHRVKLASQPRGNSSAMSRTSAARCAFSPASG